MRPNGHSSHPTTGASVLVTEDDFNVRAAVEAVLHRAGFHVRSAATGAETRSALHGDGVDLLLLDLGLPDMEGLDLLSEIQDNGRVPTIVLSARGSEADRVLALDAGADDYLVKPCSPRELVARTRAVLRRTRSNGHAGTLAFGEFEMDLDAREVRRAGTPVVVRHKEFDLLAFLAAHPRQVFSRGDLLRSVWKSDPEYQTAATVTEHVRRLRQVIEDDPAHPRYLVTVARAGYRLDP